MKNKELQNKFDDIYISQEQLILTIQEQTRQIQKNEKKDTIKQVVIVVMLYLSLGAIAALLMRELIVAV